MAGIIFGLRAVVLAVCARSALASFATPAEGGLLCETHGYRFEEKWDKQESEEYMQGREYLYRIQTHDNGSPENGTSHCSALLAKYSLKAEHFIRCSIIRAKPVCLCEACYTDYWQAMQMYQNITMQKGVCEKTLLESDRVQVLKRMNTFIVNLWTDASCEVCFHGGNLTNDTMDFYHLLNETKDCFERYIASWDHITHPNLTRPDHEDEDIEVERLMSGVPKPSKLYGNLSACTSCREKYQSLQDLYDRMRDQSRVCLDLQDQMNMTRATWDNVFDCSDYDFSRSSTVVYFLCVIFVFCIASLYVVSIIRKNRSKSQHAIRYDQVYLSRE